MKHAEVLKIHGAEIAMKAHQYLYYVLDTQVLSDYEYDKFCSRNDLFGGGGSDRKQDYDYRIQMIAKGLLEN